MAVKPIREYEPEVFQSLDVDGFKALISHSDVPLHIRPEKGFRSI